MHFFYASHPSTNIFQKQRASSCSRSHLVTLVVEKRRRSGPGSKKYFTSIPHFSGLFTE